jgi:hypothetical protein
MSLPFENPDTTFDSFLQELPADYHERAIEFKAFTRSRKIKTPTRAPRAHHLSISHHLTKGRQREIILQTSLQVTQPPRKPRHGAAVEFSEAPMVGIGLGVGFFSSGVGRCNVSSI